YLLELHPGERPGRQFHSHERLNVEPGNSAAPAQQADAEIQWQRLGRCGLQEADHLGPAPARLSGPTHRPRRDAITMARTFNRDDLSQRLQTIAQIWLEVPGVNLDQVRIADPQD